MSWFDFINKGRCPCLIIGTQDPMSDSESRLRPFIRFRRVRWLERRVSSQGWLIETLSCEYYGGPSPQKQGGPSCPMFSSWKRLQVWELTQFNYWCFGSLILVNIEKMNYAYFYFSGVFRVLVNLVKKWIILYICAQTYLQTWT